MKKILKILRKKIIPNFFLFSLLIQNIFPLSTLFVSPAHASTHIDPEKISVSFDENDHQLEIRVDEDMELDYLVEYQDIDKDATEAVQGKTHVDGEISQADVYMGTCSASDCLPINFDSGKISFTGTDYQADFSYINGQLWLKNGKLASISTVETATTYIAPQNNQVTVTFTELPENPGFLSIEEVYLSDEQAAELGAVSNVAYDITSNMEDGTFKYDLKLPVPEGADENPQIIYAEDLSNLDNVGNVEETVVGNEIAVTGLDHFTVFVVTTNPVDCSGGVYLAGSCYATLQEAIDGAIDGDTIELASNISVSQEINISTTLTIDGKGFTLTSPFTKTDNSNNSAIGIHGTNNVTIKNLIVDGAGGTDLHGINIYVSTNILLDNVTAKNYKSGIVVNGSTVTVNNVTTSGNSWHGINVDLGDGVISPAVLTVNGYSSHDDTTHILVDDYSKAVMVIDTLAQYSFSNPSGNIGIYTLQDIIAPAIPTLTSPADKAYVQPVGLFLDWSNVTDPSGPVTYYYQSSYGSAVGANNALSSVIYKSNVLGSSEIDASGSADNRYYWQAQACDAAGNCSNWSGPWEVNIDSIAPKAPQLIEPTNNAIVNGAILLSDWTDVTDAHHYIYESYHDENANNLRWHDEYTQSEKTATNVGEATFWWRVKAVDAAGNESPWSDLWKVTIDKTAPTTPVINGFLNPTLACGSVVNINYTTVDWTDSFDLNGIAKYRYAIDYPLASGLGFGHWETDIFQSQRSGSLNEGTHTIKVMALDNVGLYSSWSETCTITTDWTAPDVEITTPVAGLVSGFVDIRGTVEDDNPHHYWFVIQNSNGQTVAGPGVVNDTNSFVDALLLSWDVNAVADGEYTIKLEARDAANNKDSGSSHWVKVIIDNTAPTSIITSYDLKNGGEVETATFNGLIEGTATDGSGSGVDHVLLSIKHESFSDPAVIQYWNGGAWVGSEVLFPANGDENWDYQLSDVPEGIYTITSHAVDKAGNQESTFVIKIVFDKTIPEVALTIDPTSPDADNGWYKTLPTITLSATDNYQLDRIEYKWNSGSWATYTTPINPPGEGQNILYYRGIDKIGNTTSPGVKEVKYDVTTPAEGPLNVKVENITLDSAIGKWEKPNDSFDITRYALSWRHESGDSSGKEVGADVFEHKMENLYDGEWTFTVKAMDDAGNFKESSTKFTIGAVDGTTTTEEGTVLGDSTVGGTTVLPTGQIAEDSDEKEIKENKEKPDESGQVLGTTDCNYSIFNSPWTILVTQFALMMLSEFALRRDKKIRKISFWIIALLMPATFYLLRNENCQGSFIYKWFALPSLAVTFFSKLTGYLLIEE
ncbi:MAG: Ig-like domain-containing protein [Candidatus Paceibacterota bacterium]